MKQTLILASLLILLIVKSGFAQDAETSVQIENWLVLGEFEVKPPALGEEENLKGKNFSAENLLTFSYLDIKNLKPEEGALFNWKGEEKKWVGSKSAKDGYVLIEKNRNREDDEIAYLAAYIDVGNWVKVKLKIYSPQTFELYLNGDKLKSKTDFDAEEQEETGSITANASLEKGKHLILIKTLKTSGNKTDWKVKAEIIKDGEENDVPVQVSLNPKEIMTIEHLLNGDFINDASISPDGELVMLEYSKVTPPEGEKESWIEVRNLSDWRMIQLFREGKYYGMKWKPGGRTLSWESPGKKGSSLRTLDLANMEQSEILSNVEDLGSFTWSDDGSFIIYTVSEKPDEGDKDLKKFEGMPDRWPWWRNRSFLYRLDVASGITERLTWGYLTTSLEDISPDGSRILFSQSVPQFNERPYSKQILMEMDIATRELDTIWQKNFAGSCMYAPDGLHLLVTGSPAMFGKVGVNVTGDVIPNDYDTQAYIYDMTSGDVDPISFNFNPSITGVYWSKYDENLIYFLASDRTYRKVFSYNLNTRYFSEVNTGYDVVNSFSLAELQHLAICTGTGISTPEFVSLVDLTSGNAEVLATPRSETFENVVFGKTEDWNFVNKNGTTIEGRIYYPPDFDKRKKYPLIVYYYAGTSPTDRSFGGRYPKNLFAAQGYVVYNLQPSGATGYGQDHSAAHVNNWGITVADEIIDGTKLFLDDHDFIDPKKVGCIGASYGGFMTMLLQTRTDIFAAAVSHAGISSIASYWGEGYWGYLYSATATAGNFPWNNRKLYVEQSALFNADKINTPLLLLYGSDDTNVPPGESIQLYTALKLLGKPVELIEIEGQNHQILDYKKRIKWQKTIFAWFDKWLQDTPEWWNELFPDKNL